MDVVEKTLYNTVISGIAMDERVIGIGCQRLQITK